MRQVSPCLRETYCRVGARVHVQQVQTPIANRPAKDPRLISLYIHNIVPLLSAIDVRLVQSRMTTNTLSFSSLFHAIVWVTLSIRVVRRCVVKPSTRGVINERVIDAQSVNRPPFIIRCGCRIVLPRKPRGTESKWFIPKCFLQRVTYLIQPDASLLNIYPPFRRNSSNFYFIMWGTVKWKRF